MIVGAHWFQYLDQPASGRLLDGENGHLGLVAITDVPIRALSRRCAAATCKPLVSCARPSTNPRSDRLARLEYQFFLATTRPHSVGKTANY
jgi:hypothetical protein